MARNDPFVDAAPLIRRVYSYVAYRIGDGPEAEDLTSETFERAVRYRSSYDARRGGPLPWLIGIARRCIASRPFTPLSDPTVEELASPGDLEQSAVDRLTIVAAVATTFVAGLFFATISNHFGSEALIFPLLSFPPLGAAAGRFAARRRREAEHRTGRTGLPASGH